MNLTWLWYCGFGLLLGGTVTALFFSVRARNSVLSRIIARYLRSLDNDLRFLLLETTGKSVAQSQLVLAALCVAASLYHGLALLTLPLVAIAPRYWLRRARNKRVERIEQQLDGWLLMLANMLKATSSLGDAIRATAELAHGPLAEEIDLALKEVRLGASLDQALLTMSARVNSRLLSTNIATLLVGRSTGGELSALLEESAASLREMSRLEGVVRTQTAQGRSQFYVLVAAPIIIVIAFRGVDPTFFEPLQNTAVGNALVVASVGLWIGALIWASRVLAVDI